MQESRPYIFFNADDKYGVINQDWLLITKNDGSKNYINTKIKIHDYAKEQEEVVEKMNKYAESNLQTSQYIILNKKQ